MAECSGQRKESVNWKIEITQSEHRKNKAKQKTEFQEPVQPKQKINIYAIRVPKEKRKIVGLKKDLKK